VEEKDLKTRGLLVFLEKDAQKYMFIHWMLRIHRLTYLAEENRLAERIHC
jgi:hypothetical protein